MKRTYYVWSTNQNTSSDQSGTKQTKTITLSQTELRAAEEGAPPSFAMAELSLTLDDPAQFGDYEVGTQVTLTLAVAAE